MKFLSCLVLAMSLSSGCALFKNCGDSCKRDGEKCCQEKDKDKSKEKCKCEHKDGKDCEGKCEDGHCSREAKKKKK